jgi:signal transduction histidine kinase/ActR/RegA family two-component response regulator
VIAVPDALAGTQYSQLFPDLKDLMSYIAVPLMRDSQWTGVLCVSNDKPYEWRESEVSLVQTVAERVWLAVEKLRSEDALRRSERRAIEEYQRLLERIVPLAETLGAARDLVSIYRSLQEFICASMSCSGFFVSFYEPETRLRLPAYIWGDGEEVDAGGLPPMPISEGGGPNSRAILSKQTIITNRYWDEQRKRPHIVLRENGRDPMSSLVVPMVVQDRVVGTLEVQSYEDRAFEREHAIALEMAANLAAVAIENVRLINTEAKARREAETANKMKDEFLSVLSHELRTPLNAMLGWVRILRSGNVNEERTAKALEIIERNTRQQSSLIEDLLDVSRIISGKMRIENELIDLNPPLEQAADSVRSIAAAKGVDFDVRMNSEPLYLKGDAVRMQQVITNLLQNAVKFTPSGGHVTLDRRRKGPEAIIEVTDTGIGIESEFLPMIFDRFSQADASTKRHNTGLGLGLTIVRTIVEMHGGSISAYSDGQDTGAKFTVKLPLAEELYSFEPSIQSLPAANGRSESLAGLRILIVDDDEDSLLPLKILLETERAMVTCVRSASEALDDLRKRDFDILISDIGMPAMDGIELIAELRSGPHPRNRSIKAIAYTAYASEEDRNRFLSAGYHAHLSKPLEMDQLVAILSSLASNNAQ